MASVSLRIIKRSQLVLQKNIQVSKKPSILTES